MNDDLTAADYAIISQIIAGPGVSRSAFMGSRQPRIPAVTAGEVASALERGVIVEWLVDRGVIAGLFREMAYTLSCHTAARLRLEIGERVALRKGTISISEAEAAEIKAVDPSRQVGAWVDAELFELVPYWCDAEDYRTPTQRRADHAAGDPRRGLYTAVPALRSTVLPRRPGEYPCPHPERVADPKSLPDRSGDRLASLVASGREVNRKVRRAKRLAAWVASANCKPSRKERRAERRKAG